FLHLSLIYLSTALPPLLYPLSLHDALPIFPPADAAYMPAVAGANGVHQSEATENSGQPSAVSGQREVVDSSATHGFQNEPTDDRDRKSTRLNSSHVAISYAVFCLKKKKKHK